MLSSLLRQAIAFLVAAFLVVGPLPIADALAQTQPLTDEAPSGAADPDADGAATAQDEPLVIEQEAPPPVAVSNLPHDLSPWGMFMAADWVVKAVMIGLAFASLVTWTIWLAKTLELATATRRVSSALDRIIAARTLEEAGRAFERKRGGPAALLVRAAGHESTLR